jgi:anti-anti-sigma factor
LWYRGNCDGEVQVVVVVGEIDLATAPILREHLAGAMLAGVPRAVLDLAGVTFLDSSGLSVVIRRRGVSAPSASTTRIVAAGRK